MRSWGGILRNNAWAVACIGAALMICSSCSPTSEQNTHADLVILGKAIYTVDADQPEVEALASVGSKIVAVGTASEIEPWIGDDTRVIELDEGEIAVPGLIDSHAHLHGIGLALTQLRLGDAATWDGIVAQVAEAAERAEPGEWILGRGWHQEKWDSAPEVVVEGFPVHQELSRVAPKNPVRLTHASGHACIVNAMAMELAGIDGSTANPAGGEIVRDAGGTATGVLKETGEELIEAVIDDRESADVYARKIQLAVDECLRKGLTTLHDAGTSLEDVERLRMMAESGLLKMRLWVMLGDDNATIAPQLHRFPMRGIGDGFLTVGGIKRLMDGALGSRGAWLLEPYHDLPRSEGLNTISIDDLRESAELAFAHDLQLCVHAIGDRANREVLNVYEEFVRGRAHERDLRWRIEHAQHLSPPDIPRFAALGVIAAMQPTHCVSDGPWVPDRLGEDRAETGAYMWRDLLDSGAVIATGTDAPVEDVDPIATFHAAVTRRMADGRQFYPAQVMTRQEALEAATISSAYAAFEEEIKGSLEVGKLMDVTVLSRDIMTVEDDAIRDAEVLYTIVGGVVQYDKNDELQAQRY